jgi:hypothetical protein
MKKTIRPLLFTVLFSFSGLLFSQNDAKDLDKVYGLDQTLCNGKKYTYSVPASTKGHQFLISPDFISGSVTLKGKSYEGLSLNYDIVNQKLLLQYEDEKGGLKIIEISKAWLTRFHRGTKDFEYLSLEQEPHFYQVLGEGRLRILYYWSKKLVVNDAVGSSNFVFTDALRDPFILKDGQLKRFRTKRNLVRLFEPGQKPAIKSYLHKNKIKLKNATDQEMSELITFIGNLK